MIIFHVFKIANQLLANLHGGLTSDIYDLQTKGTKLRILPTNFMGITFVRVALTLTRTLLSI